jgi:hypothetical protein
MMRTAIFAASFIAAIAVVDVMTRHSASLLRAGVAILLGGLTFATLSTAGELARRQIRGKHG